MFAYSSTAVTRDSAHPTWASPVSSQGRWRGCHFTGEGRPPRGISKAMVQREEPRRVPCSRRRHGPAAQAALPPGGTSGRRPEWASRVWTDQLAASRHLTRCGRSLFRSDDRGTGPSFPGGRSDGLLTACASGRRCAAPSPIPSLTAPPPARGGGGGACCCGGAGLSSHAPFTKQLELFLDHSLVFLSGKGLLFNLWAKASDGALLFLM